MSFVKTKKISVKQVVKLISTVEAFVGWSYKEKPNVSEDTLDKIRSF